MRAFIAEYQQRSRVLQEAGNVLGEMQLMKELAAKYPSSMAVRSLASQQLATFLSFLGRTDEAIATFDSANAGRSTWPAVAVDSFQVVDAVDAIVRVADTSRLILVNEAHHVPQHRVLTYALLERLYDKGFRYLAAETFAETDSGLQRRGYGVRGSGYYSNEPVFGALIRKALQLGYTLVPYEAVEPGGDREMGQARKLVARTFATDSNARVLVHAGYDHINESGTLAGVPPMAIRVRELTGINPFTVDQVMMTARGRREFEHPSYRAFARVGDSAQSVAVRYSDGRLWSARPGTHDLTVISPVTTLSSGRPHWLRQLGTRTVHTMSQRVCRSEQPCVVSAYRDGVAADAIPDDRLLVNDAAAPSLVLERGSYRVVVTSARGDTISAERITVR